MKLRSRLFTSLFVAMCLIAVTFTFNTIVGFNDAHADKQQHYIEYNVSVGETLWDIAEMYADEDTDIRQAVFEICSLNDMSASDLQAGQTLLIPEEL